MSDGGGHGGSGQSGWTVRVDDQKCGLCEVCAHHCPTGALRTERTDGTLRLLFEAARCDGCPGVPGCESRCTEQALERKPCEATPTAGTAVLIEGTLVRCRNCAEPFATDRKLGAVGRRRPAERVVIREHCPVCRRTELVVRFIDEKRRPDARASYRSQPEILRRVAASRQTGC